MSLTTQQLSDADKEFIKLHQEGVKNSTAFREAYPDHPASIAYRMTEPGTPHRQKASEMLKDSAKQKLQAKYIRRALATYQEKMEEYSRLSLETAVDLVQHARSEKVRADLAIEGIRHKIGTPVTKVAVQEQKTVILTFGRPASAEPIEGEIVSAHDASEPSDPDGTDDTDDTYTA